MAAFGNTNISARPYAPTDYSKQPSGQNPYGYGYQRVAGQVAPQAPAQGYNSNYMAGARVGRPAKQLGYGPPPAPQAAVSPQMPGDVSYQPMPNPIPAPVGYGPIDSGVPVQMPSRSGNGAQFTVNGQPANWGYYANQLTAAGRYARPPHQSMSTGRVGY
jgi:hypothetical protein